MDMVIRNATLVTHKETFRGEIGIQAGKIAKIGERISGGVITIDASGKLIFPGIIDAHTHMETPVRGITSSDDFSTGTKAAAAGGVTTIVDFTIQAKGQSLREAIDMRRRQADGEVYIDYSLHCNLTDFRDGFLEEIPKIIASGITSFKVFMAYRNEGIMVSNENLKLLLEATKKYGGLVQVHAESGFLLDYLVEKAIQRGNTSPLFHPKTRPNYVEEEAVVRAIALAEEVGGNLYLVHLSTREAVEAVKWGKERGVKIFAETCPQYLLLTEEVYQWDDASYYITSPPLRSEEDREALWQGVKEGVIDVVATDHCPFTRTQKESGGGFFFKTPNGLPGVETLLSLIYSEGVVKRGLSPNKLVELLAYNPARAFGLCPRKGTIEEGSDADLVIFNPEKEVEIKADALHMNTDFSPYEGMTVKGVPELTISRGEIVYEQGNLPASPGRGKFVPTTPTH